MLVIFNSEEELSNTRFQIVYDGFLMGGSVTTAKGNIKILRREIAILDKLEAISEEFDCGKKLPNGEPCRRLLTGEHRIELDNKEFDLLYSYIETVPWTTGKSVRNAVDVLDWLNNGNKKGD